MFACRHAFVGRAALAIALLGLLAGRRWGQLASPQVWDEDGTQVVFGLVTDGWSSILEPMNGYLIVVPKLISAIALNTSISCYPLVSTLLSWAFIVFVGLAISLSPTRLSAKWLCALAVLLIPSDPEVFGLPLYTFWWASLLLFLLPIWNADGGAVLWRVCFLILGGLSSPAIIMISPLLWARAYLYRAQRAEWLIAVLGTTIAILQGCHILEASAGHAPRLHAGLLQIIPEYFGKYLINTNHNYLALSVAGIALLALLLSWFHEHRRSVPALMLAWLLFGSIAMSVARSDPESMTVGAARYVFFPWSLTSWILIQHYLSSQSPFVRRAIAVAAVAAIVNVIPKWSRSHDDLQWAAHIRSSRLYSRYSIPVHYNGRNARAWSFSLAGRTCDEWLDRDWLLNRNWDLLPTYPYRVVRVAKNDEAIDSLLQISESIRGLSVVHGSTVMTLKRGERIVYRSAPGRLAPSITIEGCDQPFLAALPSTTGWVILEFSNRNLPDEFTVRIHGDTGSPADFSAIALRELHEQVR